MGRYALALFAIALIAVTGAFLFRGAGPGDADRGTSVPRGLASQSGSTRTGAPTARERIAEEATPAPLSGGHPAAGKEKATVGGELAGTEPAAPDTWEKVAEISARADAERRMKGAAREAAIKRALEKGSSAFMKGGAKLRILSAVRGIAEGEPLPPGVEVIDTRAGYTYFFQDADKPAPAGSLPAVYNEKSSSLSVMTGKITVKPASPSAAQALADSYNMKLVQSFDDLKIAFYQSGRDTPADLAQLLAALREDQRVHQADLELLSSRRKPR